MSMLKRRIEKNESTMDGSKKWWMPDDSTIAIMEEDRRKKKEKKTSEGETFTGCWRDKKGDLLPDVLINSGNKRAYTITAKIGEGGFGIIFLGTRNDSITQNEWKVALKVVSITMTTEKNQNHWISKEVFNHQRCCVNDSILKCYEFFRTPQNYCFVMEYAYTNMMAILLKKRLMMDELRCAFSQMASAVSVVHSKNIIHHDIKPENFLMVNTNGTIKLSDFGLSYHVPENQLCFELCGTPRYMAPEIISPSLKLTSNSGHSKAVDIWSLGCTLYRMATGNHLFTESTNVLYEKESIFVKLYRSVLEQPIVFPSEMHPTLQDLLNIMLERDPLKRATIEQVLKHDFFTFIINKN